MRWPVIRLLMLVGVLMLLAGSVFRLGSAQEATPGAQTRVLPPGASVDGLDLAAWTARSWQWFFSLPPEVNPYVDTTGAICGYGQSGSVFFLTTAEHDVERTCLVPAGVHLFVPLVGAECSTLEPPPFFGRVEAELRRCATTLIDDAARTLDLDAMAVTVDGARLDDLEAYRVVTPRFTFWLPANNVLGSTRQVGDAVADGYQVLLRPLPPGEHEVVMEIPGPRPGGFATITYHLIVVTGASNGADATPAALTA